MVASVEARINPESLRHVLADSKVFGAELSKGLRARLRAAGAEAVADVRRTILEPTPGGAGPHSGGVREALAVSTKVSILSGQRKAGIRIVTTSAKLAAAHAAMLKAYNKTSWRHPNRSGGAWVDESGRPYFGSVINAHKTEMRAAVETALDDAVKTMKG